MTSFCTRAARRSIGTGLAVLLAGCLGAPAPAPQAGAPRAQVAEEPLPAYWVGAFTMVQTDSGFAGNRQFQLILGREGPNHFVARRGCYSHEGLLKRRGELWLVESSGPVRADEQCLATPDIHPGSPEQLFQHRSVMLSPPGQQRWIAEGSARWIYLQNPSAPPAPPPVKPEPDVPSAAAAPEPRHNVLAD